MLDAIGVGSLEDLFADIPESVRLGRELDLPQGQSEQEVYEHLAALAARNRHNEEEISFLGAGMYDHYVPALIDTLLSRSEFLTPYTPYQPEISQGGLQVMFEFQTAISELTGLPVSNASVYEGPSAVAAAGYLAKLETKRTKLVASRGLHPHSRAALATHAAGYGMEVVEVPLDDEGATDLEALAAAVDDDTAAVFVQQPNFLGTVEDLGALSEAGKRTGAVMVCAADPIPLGILKPPGELGVDLCVGEGQTLGNRLDFGGPSFGFFAADERFIRKMPGRIAGETRDVDGRRGFVLTLQTREQHIRREKATHNICTAQALNALAGVVYLSWLGKRGLVELSELLLRRTHYARETLGLEAINPGPVVREFAVRVPDLPAAIARAREAGLNPGYPLGRDYPEFSDGLLIAVTERRTKEHIDRLAELIGERPARPRPRRRGSAHERGHAHRLRALPRGPPGLHRTRHRRARGSGGGAAARGRDPRAPCRAAGDLRARAGAPLHHALLQELPPGRGLLPARLVHDEAQPEAPRARGGAAGPRAPASAPGPRVRPGRARADVAAPGRARRDRGAAARVAPAERRVARRAGGAAAHPRLPRGPRRAAHQGAHAGHRSRHQPGDGDDGRLRGGEGGHGARRRGRPRRPALEGGRRRGLPHAHQPEHARAVRPQHRGDRPDRPRRRRDPLLRRREPERRDGRDPPGRHGLRHRPLQPAQDVHAAARRRRPGRGPDRVLRPDRAVPADPSNHPPRGSIRSRPRAPQVDRKTARLPGQLRCLRALVCVHLLARIRTG